MCWLVHRCIKASWIQLFLDYLCSSSSDWPIWFLVVLCLRLVFLVSRYFAGRGIVMWWWESEKEWFWPFKPFLKVVSATFLLACFVCLKEDLSNKEKCFLFDLQSSFRSRDNHTLNFQIFKCHDFIKCLSMKHETHFSE